MIVESEWDYHNEEGKKHAYDNAHDVSAFSFLGWIWTKRLLYVENY